MEEYSYILSYLRSYFFYSHIYSLLYPFISTFSFLRQLSVLLFANSLTQNLTAPLIILGTTIYEQTLKYGKTPRLVGHLPNYRRVYSHVSRLCNIHQLGLKIFQTGFGFPIPDIMNLSSILTLLIFFLSSLLHHSPHSPPFFTILRHSSPL